MSRPSAIPQARCALFALIAVAVPVRCAAWVWDGVGWADYTAFLGPIDAATKVHLQLIVADGGVAGRVEGRMGQIGDSITESSAYFRNAILAGVTSNATGHDYQPICSWLAYSGTQPADGNSFYLDHGKGTEYGDHGGWELPDAIAAGHPASGVEVGDGTTPGDYSWAIIMFGTNDIDEWNWNPASWKEELRGFVQGYVDLGVVPVLSTIPPELAHVGDGHVEQANAAIVSLAGEMQVPWIDFYGLILHFQPVNWVGTLISNDGTHPTAATGGRGFSHSAQTSTDGYALRTKLAFDAAEKLRAIVFEDGVADPGATSVQPLPWSVMERTLVATPNPFRTSTSLSFELESDAAVDVLIFDAQGRRVRQAQPTTWSVAGTHEVPWDGRDDDGRSVAAGVYFVRARVNGGSQTRRVVKLR